MTEGSKSPAPLEVGTGLIDATHADVFGRTFTLRAGKYAKHSGMPVEALSYIAAACIRMLPNDK
jgi:hypothetical protein